MASRVNFQTGSGGSEESVVYFQPEAPENVPVGTLWVDSDDEVPADAAGGVLPTRATITPLDEFNAQGVAGTWTRQEFTTYTGGLWRAANVNSTHWVEWDVILQPGTYTLTVFMLKSSTSAELVFSFGSDTLATVDFYAASSQEAIVQVTGITVSESGLHGLRATPADPGPSYYYIAAISLARTGD